MKKLAYVFFCILCLGQGFDLRGQFIADRFTNRPLTLMNDATSVGWNPAVLGMTGKTDIVLVVPYDRTWQNTRLIGAFASSQGVGLGYTSVRYERLPDISYVPFSFYGGLGTKISGYNVWAGASFRYSEFGGRTIRYSGSLIYNPYDKLYLSAGLSNLYSVDTKDMVYQASATYSLLDWLTMHGRLQYCSENPIFWGEKYSSEFGIVAAINKKRIVSSFSVNPVAREARFGLEVAFDVFSIGVLSEGSTLNTPSGRFNGGNILLRVNHDSLYANEHYRYPVIECSLQKCTDQGCAGRRCYDAICPAYRCIKADCPGRSCSRSICNGLNCINGHTRTVTTVSEKHVICNHCSHPTHVRHNDNKHSHAGCPICGCSKEQHSIGNTPSDIGGGTSSSSGTSEGGKKVSGLPLDGNSKESTEKPSIQDSKPKKEEKNDDESEEENDPDSWEDEGNKEDSDADDEGEEDPFEEAEEPISENAQKFDNMEKPHNKNGGKGGIGKSYKLRRVFFDHDKWDIKPESVEELNKLKSYLTKNPDLCVRLDAHTDSNGSNEYNKELSRKRAQSVVDYLIDNGIDPTRLSAQGFGEEFPVSTNDTPEGREENRRVEFTKMGC
jgi:outer membrane protein OmpA-like peptidoglycan-associated protein